MGKFAIIVIGSAGSGKSTLCEALQNYYSTIGRTVHVCNFDPAADDLIYSPSIDIRELIDLDDAMEEKSLGPNGGMIFCLEYLMSNTSWLTSKLDDYTDDFIIIDMPGQIELTSHIPMIPRFVTLLQKLGYFTSVLFCLDAFVTCESIDKFAAGCTMSLSSMVCFDCPYVNILTKCDLLSKDFKENELSKYVNCEFDLMSWKNLRTKFGRLMKSITQLITDMNFSSFQTVDIFNNESIADLASYLDELVQYIEDAEVAAKDID